MEETSSRTGLRLGKANLNVSLDKTHLLKICKADENYYYFAHSDNTCLCRIYFLKYYNHGLCNLLVSFCTKCTCNLQIHACNKCTKCCHFSRLCTGKSVWEKDESSENCCLASCTRWQCYWGVFVFCPRTPQHVTWTLAFADNCSIHRATCCSTKGGRSSAVLKSATHHDSLPAKLKLLTLHSLSLMGLQALAKVWGITVSPDNITTVTHTYIIYIYITL